MPEMCIADEHLTRGLGRGVKASFRQVQSNTESWLDDDRKLAEILYLIKINSLVYVQRDPLDKSWPRQT